MWQKIKYGLSISQLMRALHYWKPHTPHIDSSPKFCGSRLCQVCKCWTRQGSRLGQGSRRLSLLRKAASSYEVPWRSLKIVFFHVRASIELTPTLHLLDCKPHLHGTKNGSMLKKKKKSMQVFLPSHVPLYCVSDFRNPLFQNLKFCRVVAQCWGAVMELAFPAGISLARLCSELCAVL